MLPSKSEIPNLCAAAHWCAASGKKSLKSERIRVKFSSAYARGTVHRHNREKVGNHLSLCLSGVLELSIVEMERRAVPWSFLLVEMQSFSMRSSSLHWLRNPKTILVNFLCLGSSSFQELSVEDQQSLCPPKSAKSYLLTSALLQHNRTHI